MLNKNHGLRSLALLLVVSLVVYTMPLSAAEISRATSIGQVSANGSVDLRGVRINGDGTLFSGDRMNVGSGGYAKIALGSGPRVEIGSGSDVTVTREADNVHVKMASGNIAFKGEGKSSIHVRVGTYDVTVPGDASGSVAYIGKDVFSVRVLTGSVSVRNTLTKQSYTVQKGSDRLISLQTGSVNQPFAQLASTAPAAVPSLPQAQGAGLSKGGWIALIGTMAGATAAIIVLATRNNDTDDDAATRLAQVKAIQNLTAISTAAAATNTLAANVGNSATAAISTIAASTASASVKASLTASANAIIAKANSAVSKIATLSAQVNTLQATIANQGGPPTAAQQTQLTQLFNELLSAINDANTALNDLKALATAAAAAGVNIPQPTFTPVSGPVFASASIPA
jgi:hypothetical protein